MPRVDLQYPKVAHSTVHRYSSLASYSLETIHGIINAAQFLHVSFQPEGSPFPTILPMIGKLGSFERPSAGLGDVLDLYLHGYVSSRVMNVSRKAEKPVEGEAEQPKGLPVCIAASHVDGLVLALTPNSHNYNYRSASLFGYATVVTDVPEKLYAMELITDGIVPGRWAATRVPPNAAEMQSTSVLKVRIVNGSAKMRTGPASDDKSDLEDPDVINKVWAGVVPVYTTLGTPVEAPYNKVAKVPAHIEDFRADYNSETKEHAEEIIKDALPKKGHTLLQM